MIDTKHCRGCHDDFYNGNNQHGITECWHRKTAKLMPRVRVGINQMPPYAQQPRQVPHCYTESHYVFFKPDHPSCQRPESPGCEE